MAESFPALLDALESYAPEKLDGIDLGTIEWHHRLRNQLYHQGNGLTVEREAARERRWLVFSRITNSDIESLRLYAGTHRHVFGYHRMLSK